MTNLINTTNSLVAKTNEGLFTYSEIFHSIQGEGQFTGRNTVWLRFFGCNLTCSGFGQTDPTDPSTWDLPYLNTDLSNIETVDQLPVFERGCDTAYSWSKRYKHLMHEGTKEEICQRLISKITNEYNTNGLFNNNGKKIDLCFTGGEPLLPHTQHAIIKIVEHLREIGNYPESITIETNGTQKLEPEFEAALDQWYFSYNTLSVMFSVSPKLFTVSGERPEKAIRPECIKQYSSNMGRGQLKFVVSGSKDSWDELENILAVIRTTKQIKEWPVFIMKVGGTLEGQQGIIPGHNISEADFVNEVLKRGYHYSPRVHINIWGNVVGS